MYRLIYTPPLKVVVILYDVDLSVGVLFHSVVIISYT